MKLIPLTKGQFAMVDDCDYDKLMKYKWSVDGSGYPQTSIKHRPIRMHRIILGLKGREMGDHINMNKLDNCQCNIRKCNATENVRNRGINKNNTSGFKGVAFVPIIQKYKACITVNYKCINLGSFSILMDAVIAYDIACVKYHGEFARPNFPENKSTK